MTKQGKSILILAFAVILSFISASRLLACNVTEVHIWAGKTATEAANKTNSPTTPVGILKGATAYFYGEATAQSDSEQRQLKWTYSYGDGGSDTHYTAYNDTTDTASHPYTSTGAYTITLTVERSGLANSSASNTCLVTVYSVVVTDIKFNHSFGDSADGINIAEDGTTDITVPEWVRGGQNKPAAYKKSTSVTIKARFAADDDITSAKISATASDANVLGNLGEQTVNFSGGVSDYVLFTPASSTPGSISKNTQTWQWKIRDLNGGGSSQVNINSSGEHTIYIVLDTPVPPMAEPWTEILDYACVWANTATSPSTACSYILSEGFAAHYTWNGTNCDDLSSAFHYLVTALGISCTQHFWSEPSFLRPRVDGDMMYMRTNEVDPVGSTGSGYYTFTHHQWASISGWQIDPSFEQMMTGSWGDYEDYLFLEYNWCVDVDPFQEDWTTNQSGQSSGCEAPEHRYEGTPNPNSWHGPTR